MAEPTPLIQVLLVRNPDICEDVGEALWAALKEIELFYNLGAMRVSCRRYFLTPLIPSWWGRSVFKFIRGDFSPGIEPEAVANDAQIATLRDASFWQKAQGKYSRTYNQDALGQQVRELLGPETSDKLLMLVTDQELTPPKGWRYIIWDGIQTGAAISIAPTDPQYWRDTDANRVATIKHRIRTAGLSVAGTFLGLKRCEEENCFLYDDVDSVTRLDEMVYLSAHHGLTELANRGFATRPDDPNRVQTVEMVGRPPREMDGQARA